LKFTPVFETLRPLDYGAFLISLLVITIPAMLIYGGEKNDLYFSINGQNGQHWQFPLSARETVPVTGPLGKTLVEIKNGEARIIASPCKNKVCITTGAIYKAGQFVACLPNCVTTALDGTNSGDNTVDAETW
jgi:hypothetical protein